MSIRGAIAIGTGPHDWRGLYSGSDSSPRSLGARVVGLIEGLGFDRLHNEIEALVDGRSLLNPRKNWSFVTWEEAAEHLLGHRRASKLFHEYVYILDKRQRRLLVVSALRRPDAEGYDEEDFEWCVIGNYDADTGFDELLTGMEGLTTDE